jgi:predicted Holliday junction resolvase-like endonuclease
MAGVPSADQFKEMREALERLPKKTLDSLLGQMRPLTGRLGELIATLELTEYDRLFYLGDRQPADFLAIKLKGEREGVYFIETKTAKTPLDDAEKELKRLIDENKVYHIILRVEKIGMAEPQNIEMPDRLRGGDREEM